MNDNLEKARLNGTFNFAILKRMVKRNMLVASLKRPTLVEHVIGNLEVAGEEEHVRGNLKNAKPSGTCDSQSEEACEKENMSSNLEKAMLSMLCETCDCSPEEAGEEDHVGDNFEKASL